jgi:hypothetical protein
MINKKNIAAILLLIGIIIITHQAWLLSTAVIIGSDWGFFYPQTMNEWFPIHSIWNPQLNFGYYDFVSVPFLLPYFLRGLMSVSNIDFVIIDRLLYLYPVALLAPLSMFFLCYKLTKNTIASLFGAVLYAINTYFLTIQIGHFTLALVYALFPLIFIVFSSFLKAPKYGRLLLLLLLLFIAFSNEARIAFLAVIILFFYYLFTILYFKKQYPNKKLLKITGYIILGCVLFLAMLSFLIVPLLFFRDIGIEDVSGRGFFGAEYFPIQNAFTLFHPFWDGTITTEFIPQPIPFYFWILPLVAFSALLFIKKDRKILFFATLALAGIFLGKGITEPFGNIYSWLYYNMPGFSFFREPSKFYFLIAFAYAVLFSYFTAGFFRIIESKFSVGLKSRLIKLVYIIPLSLVFVSIASPVIHGTLGDAFRQTHVPKEYDTLKDYLLNQKEFFRTMYVPNYQRFEALSSNHPSVAYLGIPKDQKTIDPEILKMFSVKYIIAPYDSTNDVYRHYAPREAWERKIGETADIKKIDNPAFGNISVYENTLGYLPHIFASDNEIYVKGAPALLKEIPSLLPDKKNAIYFSESAKNKGKKYDIQPHPLLNTYYIAANCIRCEDTKPWENFNYPFAKYLPDSPFYFYIKQKEKDALKALQPDPQIYHLQMAYFSLKRILEAQRIIDSDLNIEYLKRVLADHQLISDTLSAYYDQVDNTALQNNDYLLKLQDYVEIEEKILGDIMRGKAENEDTLITTLLQNEYYRLDAINTKLKRKIWLSTDGIKKYTVDVPESTKAEIIIKNDDTFANYDLKLRQEKLDKVSESNGWISYGERRFEKGLNPLSIELTNEKNLVATSEAVLSAKGEEGFKKYTIPVTHFNEENELIVSFTYNLLQGKPARFFLSQDADRISNGIPEVELNQYLKIGNAWNTVSGKITPKEGSKRVNLEFWVEGEIGHDSTLIVKDLKVQSVVKPIILLRENKTVSSINPINVEVKTIDPTHYQAIVTGATEPYTLVFNELFHNGWRASIDNQNIPDEKHIEMNGYANAWFVDKTGNYTVDLYFTPQKYYTIGIGISVVVLALLLLSAIYFRKR